MVSNHRDSDAEKELVKEAKELIMKKYNMTEEEAYHFIRKTAMNNLMRKSAIARGILSAN